MPLIHCKQGEVDAALQFCCSDIWQTVQISGNQALTCLCLTTVFNTYRTPVKNYLEMLLLDAVAGICTAALLFLLLVNCLISLLSIFCNTSIL